MLFVFNIHLHLFCCFRLSSTFLKSFCFLCVPVIVFHCFDDHDSYRSQISANRTRKCVLAALQRLGAVSNCTTTHHFDSTQLSWLDECYRHDHRGVAQTSAERREEGQTIITAINSLSVLPVIGLLDRAPATFSFVHVVCQSAPRNSSR